MSPRSLAIGACPHVCSLLSYSCPLLCCHSVFVHLHTVYLSLLSPLCHPVTSTVCVPCHMSPLCHPVTSTVCVPCHMSPLCHPVTTTVCVPCHMSPLCHPVTTTICIPCHMSPLCCHSVTATLFTEPKPLVEASVIMRNAKGSQTKEFK